MSIHSKHPNGDLEISTVIRAMDLIKIANQLFNDKMGYVRIAVTHSDNEDRDGSVKISAMPLDSEDDITEYKVIPSFTAVEFPEDF